MIVIVIISYLIAGAFNLGYGYYHIKLNLVVRAFVYPFMQLLTELPNILTMYCLHWQSYKPEKLLNSNKDEVQELEGTPTEQWGVSNEDEEESKSQRSSF